MDNNSQPSSTQQDHETPWHALELADVENRLGTQPTGLTEHEVEERVSRFGRNVLAEARRDPQIVVFLKQFRSPLIYVLVVAALATLVVGEYIDTAVIAAVLLLNAIIGFAQEHKAEESVLALRKIIAPKAHAVRDGRDYEVESAELVPGDRVILESGARIPADIRVASATQLMVDESLLTGESVPVQKRAETIDPAIGVLDRSNMLLAGATITSGRGSGYVVWTGAHTALGGIAEQIRTREVARTPLQERMDRFAKIVGLAVLVMTMVAVGFGIAIGVSASEMFLAGVALAVATVPEGLPIVFTITLAIGVHRMARRNAIIRRLSAVETLGSTTIIGSDKTGTLTENRMTVQEVWTADQRLRRDDEVGDGWVVDPSASTLSDLSGPSAIRSTLMAGVLANEAVIYEPNSESVGYGDPTELALLTVSRELGMNPVDAREQHEILADIPFEPDLQYSASLRRMNGTARVFVKGAPERVLKMTTSMHRGADLVPLEREQIEEAAAEMAGRGLRVLATAAKDFAPDSVPTDGLAEPANLTFTGLFGLLDPPRQGVRESVARCQQAGIRIIMITGDHAATARAIAADLGIATADADVLTGDDLQLFDDSELEAAVQRVAVFARVSPEHKLRIAEACRRMGEVVAITGDGVNDAPALKAADIGIAMGESGTDVAREAADMVLTDDNFVSIYAAVEQGRVTFDNLRKVTFFLISTAIGAPLVLLATLAFGWPLPFVPAQLLWLNLVTNGLQDIALAFEPGEPDVLDRKPRHRSEGIISRLLWERSVITGLVLATGTLTMFWWTLDRGGTVSEAQTVAITTLVIFQMFHVGNARSDYRSAFRISPFGNPFLLIATGAAFLIHVGALYFGPTQFVLRVEPISLQAWLYIIPTALTIVAAVEIHKLIRGSPARA